MIKPNLKPNTAQSPAPWHFSSASQADGSHPRYEIGAVHGEQIARLDFSEPDDAATSRQYHNAKLIAAAPDLLNALEMCACWLETNRPLEANKKSDIARIALNAARAALAKVRAS